MSDVRELGSAAHVAVWDPVVRYGHWLLVIAFGVAYLTAEEEGAVPSRSMCGPATLSASSSFCACCGALSDRSGRRFRDFVYGPVTTVRYLADLLSGRARRYLGHSPAGGAMVILLRLSLTATLLTGLIAYGDRGKGPLAENGTPLVTAAYADEDKDGPRRGVERPNGQDGESALGEVHSTLANITLALVILHVIGIGLASVVHRENLVLAMINGRKRRDG